MFDGLESTGRLQVDPRALQSRYLEEVERFGQELRRGCGKMHIDLNMFDTSTPLDVALSGYLATRSARLRQRASRVMAGK